MNLIACSGNRCTCPRSQMVALYNAAADDVRQRFVDMALDEPELSTRELAVRFTNTQRYFVSEASVYRLLKALDLITSPAFAPGARKRQ